MKGLIKSTAIRKKKSLQIKNELYKELLNEMSEKDLDKKVKDTLDILKQRGYKTAIASSSKNAKLYFIQS